MTHTAIIRRVRARPPDGRTQPVQQQRAIGQRREIVVQRLMPQRILGLALLRHVVEREHRSVQPAIVIDDRLSPRAPVAQLAVRADDRVFLATDRIAAQEPRDRRVGRGQRRDAVVLDVDAAPEPFICALTRPRTAVVALENLVPEHDRTLGVRRDDACVGMVDDGSQKCEFSVAAGGGTGAHPAGYRHVTLGT